MDVLEKMNRRFGVWYERLFGATDGAPELRPREILRRIVAALEDRRQEGVDGQVYIPNVCTLRIVVEGDDQREFVRAFLNPDELAEKVLERLSRHSYRLRGSFLLAIEEVEPGEGVEPLEIDCRFDSAPSPSSLHSDPSPGKRDSEGALASVTVIGADGRREEAVVGPEGLSIGRSRSVGNDLVIDSDPMVSKKHLRIVFEGGRFLAYDEHSTNGTTVEGTPLTPGHGWPLADGDELCIGQTRLLFSTDSDPKTVPAPPLRSPERETEGEVFCLVSASGERHMLSSEMLIGRALTDDILVTGEGVSAQHARITVRGRHVYLEDLDTPGGTCINGVRLRPGDAAALQAGDRVTVGSVALKLELLR